MKTFKLVNQVLFGLCYGYAKKDEFLEEISMYDLCYKDYFD